MGIESQLGYPDFGLRPLLGCLRTVGCPFLIGGSAASGVWGQRRTTNDIDFLVRMTEEQARWFCSVLPPDFYRDEDTVVTSLRLRRSFNLIHIPSVFKYDFFPAQSEFDFMQLERRQLQELPLFGPELTAPVAAAEDILVQKLRWFRMGGENSVQQWRDVKGILEISGPELNYEHLEFWAEKLGVLDLWKQLLAETEIPPPERPGDVPF
jgi:hypothetical protein